MIMLLRVAVAAVSLATIGSAYGADSQIGMSRQPPAVVQLSESPPPATEPPAFVHSSRKSWLFPPIGKYLAG